MSALFNRTLADPPPETTVAQGGAAVSPPATLGGKLWVWRYLILRRTVQVGVLLMFFGTAHWGWQVARTRRC